MVLSGLLPLGRLKPLHQWLIARTVDLAMVCLMRKVQQKEVNGASTMSEDGRRCKWTHCPLIDFLRRSSMANPQISSTGDGSRHATAKPTSERRLHLRNVCPWMIVPPASTPALPALTRGKRSNGCCTISPTVGFAQRGHSMFTAWPGPLRMLTGSSSSPSPPLAVERQHALQSAAPVESATIGSSSSLAQYSMSCV